MIRWVLASLLALAVLFGGIAPEPVSAANGKNKAGQTEFVKKKDKKGKKGKKKKGKKGKKKKGKKGEKKSKKGEKKKGKKGKKSASVRQQAV